MNSETLKFLHDIIDSTNNIEIHLAQTHSINQFSADITISDAVEPRLAIIGEALWSIYKLEQKITISDHKKIIGLRYILVHVYDLIDDATIFKICQHSSNIKKRKSHTY